MSRLPGERGPRGDHGQHGETGARGERGARGRSSWGEWVRWALTMAAVAVTLLNTHNVGQNTEDLRELGEANAARIQFEHMEAKQNEREAAERREQSCEVAAKEYKNDRIEYLSSRHDLKATLSYLRDKRNEAEAPLLYSLIKVGAKDTRRDFRHERREYRDSRPPAYCSEFNKEK